VGGWKSLLQGGGVISLFLGCFTWHTVQKQTLTLGQTAAEFHAETDCTAMYAVGQHSDLADVHRRHQTVTHYCRCVAVTAQNLQQTRHMSLSSSLSNYVYYSIRHQIACFKAAEGLHPILLRGSKSPVQRC
jgi:hypothetical protein